MRRYRIFKTGPCDIQLRDPMPGEGISVAINPTWIADRMQANHTYFIYAKHNGACVVNNHLDPVAMVFFGIITTDRNGEIREFSTT